MTQSEVLEFAQHYIQGWTKRQLAHFLSQTGHESADFTRLEENLNYSAAALARTWPNRFRGADGKPNHLANQIGGNKIAVGSNVYANRLGNGGVETGEGYKFRGRGLIQVTGKSNYRDCSLKLFGDTRLIETPDLLLEPKNAVASAFWYWELRGLKSIDSVEALTKKINGGLIGIDDRKRRFEKLLSTL